jgi:pyruvate/2-oxoglutarate dehydrogenase complex dihydrolipoamide acyltransferase (E2) component
MTDVSVPFAGTVVRVLVDAGASVHQGAELLVVESMKMEHAIAAPTSGVVTSLHAKVGDAIAAGEVLLTIADGPVDAPAAPGSPISETDTNGEPGGRPELAELRARVALTLDDARPEPTARRHAAGRRTTRENVADLVDAGSFEEYGALVVAAQRARRSVEELIERTPADGLITGIGRVNGDLFPDHHDHHDHHDRAVARCAVVAYDYTVLAGTQGQRTT